MLTPVAVKILFQFCSHMAVSYSSEEIQIPEFNEELLKTGDRVNESQSELEQQFKKLQEQLEKDEVDRQKLEEQKEELQKRNKALAERAKSRQPQTKHIPQLIPESVTRKLYIDVLLKEAGWNKLTEGKELEYEVKGMPISTNPSGIGYWNGLIPELNCILALYAITTGTIK
mgnify:CR=1 FL=1